MTVPRPIADSRSTAGSPARHLEGNSLPHTTLPLAPLPTERRSGLDAVLAARPSIEAFAQRAVASGLPSVYLLGSGGGLVAHGVLQYELERRATHFPAFVLSANEFIYRHPAQLMPGSLVVVASNTGMTTEVVRAAEVAKSRGATVAAVTRLPESPVAKASDVAWTYPDDDDGVGDPKQLALALLGNSLLHETGDLSLTDYTARVASLEALPDVMLEACQQTEELNRRIAAELAPAPIIYVLGAGPNHAIAYGFAMCYLQEMQWKHAASFDSAEFLHGAMEVVVDDVPVIVLIGEAETRPIDERAWAFVEKYTRRGFAIDTRDLALTGIAPEARGYASAFVLSALTGRLAHHFEAATGHALKLRRYMFQVEY